MADFADIASDLSAAALEESIAAASPPIACAATHCEDCLDLIKPARKAAVPWASRCADCQGAVEFERCKHRGLAK